MIHVAILAGGSGTRFWPKSRAGLPKQFLRFGAGTMLAETVARTSAVAPAQRTWVVTGAAHAELVRRELPALAPDHVVGEPLARDTAPAVGLAALLAVHEDPDALLVVCPADHRITPPERFAVAVRAAVELIAQQPERIVIFGIRPTEAATGFGYIEQAASLASAAGLPVFEVATFHEKPARAVAEGYVASGRFFWNAGLFCFRAATMLAEIERQLPALASGLAELRRSVGGPRFAAELARLYPGLPKISIDQGVMERTPARLLVVPDYQWDDVGSFAALARHHPADAQRNVALGSLVALDATDNVVDAGDGLVALIGVKGLVVVHAGDVTLVCPRERAEEVKQMVEEVRRRGGLERHL